MPQDAAASQNATEPATRERIPLSSASSLIAVIPAAGLGTRLRPLSQVIPKELLPVAGRLALWRIVDELHAAGIGKLVFVVSPEKYEVIQTSLSVLAKPAEGPSFHFAVQSTMRGLGDAVYCARSYLSDAPFVVALGDAVFEEPQTGGLTRRLVDATLANGFDLGLAVQEVPRERLSRYGVVAPRTPRNTVFSPTVAENIAFPINDIIEKPTPEAAPSPYAAAARYVLAPDIFDFLEQTELDGKGELQLTHALSAMLRTGRTGVAVPLRPGEIRHDIGGLDSFYRAFVAFALADEEHGKELGLFIQRRLSLH